MTHNNSNITLKDKTNGRCLALFPGAFRPPHRAHYEAVLNLVSRQDIDEVIVIITNRCRHIPGTSTALDTDVAKKIWSIYLQGIAKVRVELAPHSAVKHALSYFERVNENDSLLFCAGASELKQGQGRFRKINSLSQKFGIPASIIASSSPPLPGGATALRTHLANEYFGYETFIAGLPKHLSVAQCKQVWQICLQGKREMHDIAQSRIRQIIEQQGLGEIDIISSARDGKVDATLCVQLRSGKRVFVKTANDTVKAATLGQPLSLKPRNRVYAERRAIKWLSAQKSFDVNIPEVMVFDNQSKTLVLSAVYANGRTLQAELQKGSFDPLIAWKTSAFLAQCHHQSDAIEPFWGDAEADLRHWKKILFLRTLGLQTEHFPESINLGLATLQRESDNATQRGFFHLDYTPKNIRLLENEIGIIDFELSSTIGDPAYDFGSFLGHYLFWGIVTASDYECQQALHTAINSYQQVLSDAWLSIYPRIIAFCAAAIIDCVNQLRQPQQLQTRLLSLAAVLLEQQSDAEETFKLIFYHAFDKA